MDNVWFYQIYAGIKPMPKMNLMLALSYAMADKETEERRGRRGFPGVLQPGEPGDGVRFPDKYGTELDFIGTYKIYDNLTYMIGIGYLWTLDYFKGYDINTTVRDNYLLSHKLTLNF